MDDIKRGKQMKLFQKKKAAPVGPEFPKIDSSKMKSPKVQDLGLKEKKETGQYVYAIIGVLVAAVLFATLVYLERYINTPKHSTMTVVASKEIPRGTVLTEDNWKEFLTGKAMDDLYRPKDALSSVNALIGTKTLVDIGKGSILSTKETVSTKDVEQSFTDPVEVSMSVSADNADAGLLRKGDLVNFMLSGNSDGSLTADFAMENVYIKQAFDGDGNPIATNDQTTKASVLQILLNKDDQSVFSKAINSGETMMVSRVVDTETGYEKILQNKAQGTNQTNQAADQTNADPTGEPATDKQADTSEAAQ
jgi:hypothetical protein